jgi:hypothetical protein
MQISISKLQQDLATYLKTAQPTPAAPVQLLESMVCAVYSCETPHGFTYIHLNVQLKEGEFAPEVIDTYNRANIQEAAEHKALLSQIQTLQQHLITSMEPHSVYVEDVYPHRLASLLGRAGVWLVDKTHSVFTAAR